MKKSILASMAVVCLTNLFVVNTLAAQRDQVRVGLYVSVYQQNPETGNFWLTEKKTIPLQELSFRAETTYYERNALSRQLICMSGGGCNHHYDQAKKETPLQIVSAQQTESGSVVSLSTNELSDEVLNKAPISVYYGKKRCYPESNKETIADHSCSRQLIPTVMNEKFTQAGDIHFIAASDYRLLEAAISSDEQSISSLLRTLKSKMAEVGSATGSMPINVSIQLRENYISYYKNEEQAAQAKNEDRVFQYRGSAKLVVDTSKAVDMFKIELPQGQFYSDIEIYPSIGALAAVVASTRQTVYAGEGKLRMR